MAKELFIVFFRTLRQTVCHVVEERNEFLIMIHLLYDKGYYTTGLTPRAYHTTKSLSSQIKCSDNSKTSSHILYYSDIWS